MPRNDGQTARRGRRRNQGHRMHRKTRAARRLAKTGPSRRASTVGGFVQTAWGRSAA